MQKAAIFYTDKADVYVCDGFTGNVILKFAESIYDIVQNRKIDDEHFNRFNFEIYGGVPVLRCKQTCDNRAWHISCKSI